MYSCKITIHFVACPPEVVEVIRGIRPLASFSHIFEESAAPSSLIAAHADLVIIGPGVDEAEVMLLAGSAKPGAQIITLADRQLAPELLPKITDVWRLPMDNMELAFRFGNWQKTYKLARDLDQSDQFLECLMNTSPNLIWFKDKNGIHELVNSSFCCTVNKSRAQVQGRGHAFIWDVEQDDPACIESERIVMESGRVHTSEEHITTGEGDRILITYKAPLRDNDDSMMGTMGIGIDVTRERQYQQRLIQNNAALEAIFTTMDCGILCQSLDGNRILSVNNAALKMLGYKDIDDLKANFQAMASTVVDEDRAGLREAIGRLKNVGEIASYEYRVRHRDGALLHIMGNAKLVEKDGELVCQRFLLDCTAQKLAEEKRQTERERRQKELVRALSIDFQLVCMLEEGMQDGKVLQLLEYPDKQLKNIFGNALSLNQKIKAYIAKCVHPDDREACEREFSPAALRARLANNEIHYFNYRTINDGKVHYFQMKAVRTGTGADTYGIIIGLQSVDSRIRHEMERRNALSEALKQAKKASQAKSAFLSNMSHDIRTPMNAVLGYATLALNHPENPASVKGYLNKILDSGGHLVSLINDILDMSHIESGKVQLEESLWHLPLLLRELWTIVKPMADSKQQALYLDADNIQEKDIYCDKLRLNQVLLNLLGNAIKYTGQRGEIRMSVSQIPCSLPGHASFEFRVKDNGMGMSKEFLERIFEPFEREQTSATSGIQGTGLGMAITRNIVDLMKGEISVQSELNAGSEFTVLLTFRCQQENASEVRNDVEVIHRGVDRGKREGRILLVEDNEMNQEIAYEFLSDAGYEVVIAGNGQEAIDQLMAGDPFNIVLMDVQMPIMNGYTATGLIRALPDREIASIPIIAMTANSFEEDRMEALNRGMNGHIAKPIDFKALFRMLDSFLIRQPGQEKQSASNLAT